MLLALSWSVALHFTLTQARRASRLLTGKHKWEPISPGPRFPLLAYCTMLELKRVLHRPFGAHVTHLDSAETIFPLNILLIFFLLLLIFKSFFLLSSLSQVSYRCFYLERIDRFLCGVNLCSLLGV